MFPQGIIPPLHQTEFIVALLEAGDIQAARAWQKVKYDEGRLAALDGERFCDAYPAAWQRGYLDVIKLTQEGL